MNNLSLSWIKKNHLKLINKTLPEKINNNSILIKIKSASICGSDLKILKNGSSRVKKGRTIGHELSGIIFKKGSNIKKFKKGDSVSLGADYPCMKCYYCKNNQANNCISNSAIGHEINGGFANYLMLNKSFLENGPIKKFDKNKIDFDEACLAEPLACCLNGFSKVGNVQKKNVLIFGAGSIGNLLCMLAIYLKAKNVFLVDIDEKKLNISKKIHGNKIQILNANYNYFKKVMKKTNDLGCQIIFTACSNFEAIKNSFKLLSKNSFLNIFGGLAKNQIKKLNLSPNMFHYNEVTVTGSHGSTPEQHCYALKLIEKKRINVKKIITNKFVLQDYLDAFEIAKSKHSMKVVINPNE